MSVEPIVTSSLKILVVEDNPVIQRTLSLALKNKGYQVFIASDISPALSTVRQEKPDLILLDLSFPFNPADVGGPLQDGFFVIEWLRRAPGAEKIPIIIISGTDPVKYKDQISAAGIVACFQKPLNHDELLAIIQSTLAGNATARQLNQT
jgi:two-component system KDP operon response regulator KdpE